MNITKMFSIFHEFDLSLAQPAMASDSFQNRKVLYAGKKLLLRYTNFVEMMCPIFSRQALERLFYTFTQSPSGWGLDFLWAHLLDNPKRKIAILDQTPVSHTRPNRSGSFYKTCTGMGINPREDYLRVLRSHRLYPAPEIKVYEMIQEVSPVVTPAAVE